MNVDELPELMSVGDAAKYWNVSARTVVRWTKAGLLPVACRTLGGHRRLAREAVMAARDATSESAADAHEAVAVAGLSFRVCGCCSRAKDEPVAWPCAVGQ